MGRISRHNRFLGAIGALALLAVAIVGLSYGNTESQRLVIEQDARHLTALRGIASELTDAIRDQEIAIHDFLLAPGPEPLGVYRAAVEVERSAALELNAAASSLPAFADAATSIAKFTEAWRSDFAEPAIAAGSGEPADLVPFVEDALGDHEAIDDALTPLGAQLVAAQDKIQARTDDLAALRTVVTGFGLAVMVAACLLAMMLLRRYGRTLEVDARHAGVINSFTVVTSFAADDTSVAASTLEAIALLVRPDASVAHVLNHSKDRAIPEAATGKAIAEVLTLNALSRCVGVQRATMHVTEDLCAPLSVHCPAYPAASGTLACLPLNSGESVGAVHLYWEHPGAFPLEPRTNVARIAEHAALAIGNRRLLAALHGQADTDPRTGLANTRAFDRALDTALIARRPEEPLAVLMLDIDHFKDFNDQYGHPAGDEALRTFAGVLRSCMRDGDLAARYGGEEFAVLLTGLDGVAARAVAERIRMRTESTVLSLSPGQTARLSVSVGIASAPAQATERVPLMRIADEALYRAKANGRNQVEFLGPQAAGAEMSSEESSSASEHRAGVSRAA
jgi:diguanylate cyclase (GGDEF)-like protein